MSKAKPVPKEALRAWLRKIFSYCDTWDLEDALGIETGADDDENTAVEYAVNKYIDDLYPVIFDHFESVPYMTGHDEDGDGFFEHDFLYGEAFEFDYDIPESYMDGVNEYQLCDAYYLVITGEIVHCKSFHFKSRSVEFTHTYLVETSTDGEVDTDIDPFNVCEIFDSIIDSKED